MLKLLFKDICFGEVIILEKKWLFTNYDYPSFIRNIIKN